MCTGKASGSRVQQRTERYVAMPLWLGCLLSLMLGPLAWAQGPSLSRVRYRCEAVYLPARMTWLRSVEIAYDSQQLRAVWIDGAPAHRFSVSGTEIRTSLDNERIRFDTASLGWQSDLRGLAQAQGRCVRSES